jgi:hypothetical protein
LVIDSLSFHWFASTLFLSYLLLVLVSSHSSSSSGVDLRCLGYYAMPCLISSSVIHNGSIVVSSFLFVHG